MNEEELRRELDEIHSKIAELERQRPHPKQRGKGVSFHRTLEHKREVVLFAQSTTSTIAAKRFGCSDNSVRQWMKQLNIPRRKVGNLTNAEIKEIEAAKGNYGSNDQTPHVSGGARSGCGVQPGAGVDHEGRSQLGLVLRAVPKGQPSGSAQAATVRVPVRQESAHVCGRDDGRAGPLVPPMRRLRRSAQASADTGSGTRKCG